MTDTSDDMMRLLMQAQGSTAFVQALGAEITIAEQGRTTIRLPYSAKIVGNPDTGVVHGGVITGLLDHACGMAVGSAVGLVVGNAERRKVGGFATLDLRIDYMKAAKPNADILVVGECVKVTHQIIFARGHAYQESEDDPIALATGTFIMTEPRPES